jgi:hypothetical protein
MPNDITPRGKNAASRAGFRLLNGETGVVARVCLMAAENIGEVVGIVGEAFADSPNRANQSHLRRRSPF